MAKAHADHPGGAPWTLADIPFHAIARDAVRQDELLFYVLAAASFIEITSDLYTRNLVAYFGDDREVAQWLARNWESEELQHGAALRRYVESAWPDFDWEAAYRSFWGEFSWTCSVDQLAETRALEMAARCVVETGTATFYRTLAALSPEPVLRQLAAHISSDEVRHYKHFYRFFMRYGARERPGRLAILRTLWARVAEVDAEDAFYAFKHVYLARHPGAEFKPSDYLAVRNAFKRLARRHFPVGMAFKMLLKPLGLNAAVGRLLVPAVASATRLLLLM